MARVLIVAGENVAARNMRNKLEEWGYRVTSICASVEEMIASVEKDKPDWVLMDVLLHDQEAIEVERQITLRTNIPILYICFTAHATDIRAQRNTAAVITPLGYVIKPYSDETLRNSIERDLCQHYGVEQILESTVEVSVPPPIRVLLVDSHQIVLWGLEKLIDTEKPRMIVVGKATNGTDARRLIMEQKPDILLLNIFLDNKNCADFIPDFVKNGHTRVVVFTEVSDMKAVDRAVFNGARGVVHKKESTQTIIKAIKKVHSGELWLDRSTTSRIFVEFSRAGGKSPVKDLDAEKITTLTRKEQMIVRAFAQGVGGRQNKQIAAVLCISEHTLRNHLTSIFSKLGITNRFDLFIFAKRHYHQPSSLINSTSESFRKANND